MPRSARVAVGGMVYHVLNRANGRLALFDRDEDYVRFEETLAEAHQRVAMRTIGYCVMPNHWHLMLWPREDGDLSEFMRWLTVTHTQRWHAAHGTAGTGHLYQGRFKSFPVECRRPTAGQRVAGTVASEDPLWTVLAYVERNALRAGLVSRAEDWRWSSLWRRRFGDAEARSMLTDPPGGLPRRWRARVNRPEGQEALVCLRQCVARGRPFGEDAWVRRAAARLSLTSTLRPPGRPSKSKNGS